MTRRRFYAPPEAFATDLASVKLSGDETTHLRNVLRLKAGDEVYVFDGAGREFRGAIDSLNRDQTSIRIAQEVRPSATESPLTLTMAIALLKGEKFDLVIQKLTELGVSCVVPVITARADVRLRNDHEAARKVIRWRRIVMEATKQCGRARLIAVEAPIAFNDFVDHARTETAHRIMFAERNGETFDESIEADPPSSVAALIGSEGGWTDEEINRARKASWRIVTLGERVLRAETAAIAVAALLQHRFGDLG